MSDQEHAELMDRREAEEWELVERIKFVSDLADWDWDLAKEVASALGLTYKEGK